MEPQVQRGDRGEPGTPGNPGNRYDSECCCHVTYWSNDLDDALRSNMRTKILKDASNTKNVIILLMSYNLHMDTCKTVINTGH